MTPVVELASTRFDAVAVPEKAMVVELVSVPAVAKIAVVASVELAVTEMPP
jgi:hypothetical protein